MPTHCPPLIRARIKAATRELVAAVGGNSAAAGIAGISAGLMSRAASDERDDLLPFAAAIALETAAGMPVMASLFDDLTGHVVQPAEGGVSAGDGITDRMVAIVGEAADVTKTLAEAVRDGRVTPREAAGALGEIGDLERVLVATKKDLVRIKGRL